MNAELERQVESLFHELADLPHLGRQRTLEERTITPELRVRVERLLALHDTSCDPGLRTPLFGRPLDWATRPEPMLPLRIGRYEVVGLVGEGGMSIVYEAFQARPRRTVAIKVVRHILASDTMHRRLQFEAEVLGQLQHPAIAQIFEAGMADIEFAGGIVQQPFLAMEFVRGLSVTAHADARRLGVRPRVELMALVCEGVSYAHQKGVIHRDLKPANILVKESDGSDTYCGIGQPKVLDFGIALTLEGDWAAQHTRTGEGQILGTLAYMSPEQVRGDRSQVDTRSDVYSLGVILYELLVGKLPHDITGMPVLDAIRQICETQPAQLGSVAPHLGRELHAICARALHSDKTRRYQSAADLALDLRHFLRNEPVAARGDSTLYVLRKTARRYRAPIAVTFILVLGLMGFALYAASQARHFNRIAQSEKEAHWTAVSEARKAEQTAKFMQDLLSSADPNRGNRAGITVRELLNNAAGKIDTELGGQPDLQFNAHKIFYLAFSNLGAFREAVEQAQWLLDYAKLVYGDAHLETIKWESSLGESLLQTGRFSEARIIFERLLPQAQKLYGPYEPATISLMIRLGAVCDDEHRYLDAERYWQEAFFVARRHHGEDSWLATRSMGNLAWFYSYMGQLDRAEQLLSDVVERCVRMPEREYPWRVEMRDRLTQVLLRKGRFEEAEGIGRENLKAAREMLGAEHRATRRALRSLASVLRRQGRFTEAELLARECMTATRDALGPDHMDSRNALKDHGFILRELGSLAEAESEWLELLAVERHASQGAHSAPLTSLERLHTIAMTQGNPEKAQEYEAQKFDLLRKAAESNDAKPYELINCAFYRAWDDPSELRDLPSADELVERAIAKWERKEGSLIDVFEQDGTVISLVTRFGADGDYSEAERFLRGTLVLRERQVPNDPARIGHTMSLLGEYLTGQGRFAEAEPLLVDGFEKMGTDSQIYAERGPAALQQLVNLYERWDAAEPAQGHKEKADAFRAALEALKK